MIMKSGIVKHFGELIRKTEQNIIEKINDGRLQTEPSITDRFLQEVERVFDEHGGSNGIRFRASTLRDRGANAPEKEFGADFCGVLDVKLPEFKQSKGFLAQAKSERQGISIYRGPFGVNGVTIPVSNKPDGLRTQATRMLSITPDSFIIIYSVSGFVVVPASAIQGLSYRSAQLYGKPLDRFFKEFIMCFVGDPKLKAWDNQTLEKIRRETYARSAILFQIQEEL